jgi:hypothetical protein
MYTTYHLSSAEELNADIINAIKTLFKSKPITIIVEDNDEDIVLTTEMKAILDERLQENGSDDVSADESIHHLKSKYGL